MVNRQQRSGRVLLAIAVAALACGVGAVGMWQQQQATASMHLAAASHRMVGAVLDLEGAVRGYALTGESAFVDDYAAAFDRFLAAVAEAERESTESASIGALLDEQVQIALRWNSLAELELDPEVARSEAAKAARTMDRNGVLSEFRAANERFEQAAAARHDEVLRDSILLGVAVVLLGAVALGLAHHVLLGRALARELETERARQRFRGALQVARKPVDAVRLLRSHVIERHPGSDISVVAVEDGQLVPVSPPSPVVLGAGLLTARPQSCRSIRLGQARSSSQDCERCSVCDVVAGSTKCVPMVAGGLVLGSAILSGPAADAVELEVTLAEFAPALAHLVELARLEEAASVDALTGLANRRTGAEALDRLGARAERRSAPLSVLMVDVDRFKSVNDELGHAAGDVVLRAVAGVLEAEVRRDDVVARFGGEEFVVLLPGADQADAARLATRLLERVRHVTEACIGRPVTVSIGVAAAPSDCPVDRLLPVADERLLAAKRAGRNRVELGPISIAVS